MSRPILAALILLVAPTFVLAQAGETKSAAKQDPQAAYDTLVKDLNKAVAEWQEVAQAAVKKAQAEGGKFPAIAMTPPTKEFIARAQELAAEYAGKDDAVRFLGFIIKSASEERNAVKQAVETLASDHAKSPAIGNVLEHLGMAAMRFGAKKQVLGLLDEVVANHPETDCKAKAMITRGQIRLESARSDEDRKAAEEDLRGVASITKDEALLAQAKDALFEIEHLQVGCASPEITGVDTDGTKFKLSDYRGKVVLLDFWGFW